MKNSSTSILEMILLIVIVLVLVGYYFNKLSKQSKQSKLKPTVVDADVDLILNPANAKQQVKENYSIFNKTEYSIGTTTAKNIDIKLTWTNGPTFTPVTKLYFRHLVNSSVVRGDTEITDVSYFESNKTNEYIFLGSTFTSDAVVGDNEIEMYWNEIKEDNKLTTVKFSITQRDLDSTLDLAKSTTIPVPVQLSTSSTASGTVTSTYTRYTIQPFFNDPIRIGESGSNDNSFNIIDDNGTNKSIDGVDKFYIVNALGKFFLSKDPNGDYILSGDSNKFETKSVIFGNIDSVNNSSIEVKVVQDNCVFKPPSFSSSDVNNFLQYDNETYNDRCDDAGIDQCDATDNFFEPSDFDYTPINCNPDLNSCKVVLDAQSAYFNNAKNNLQYQTYSDMCKKS